MARAAMRGAVTLQPELFRTLIEQIRWGFDAAEITYDHTTRTPGHIYQLPRFVHGTNIALKWDSPLVGIVEQGSLPPALQWSYVDRTGSGAGVCNPLEASEVSEQQPFKVTTHQYRTTRDLSRKIEAIKSIERDAKWELIERFRPRAIDLAMIAGRRVSIELTSGRDRSGAIDRLEAESIVDDYLLGTSESPATRWSALLQRASGDLRDGIGDRLTFLETNVTSYLDEAIRRKIGDPEKGRVIRSIHRELGQQSTIPRIQEAYKARYPRR